MHKSIKAAGDIAKTGTAVTIKTKIKMKPTGKRDTSKRGMTSGRR